MLSVHVAAPAGQPPARPLPARWGQPPALLASHPALRGRPSGLQEPSGLLFVSWFLKRFLVPV